MIKFAWLKILKARVIHMINFAWLKTDEQNQNDDQILKARVSHMIKFTWLKTNEHNHNDDQILKARVSHMIKFTWLKTDEQFFLKRKTKIKAYRKLKKTSHAQPMKKRHMPIT